MSRILIVFLLLSGCVQSNVRPRQSELELIKKCAYVNIIKDPEISCSFPASDASLFLSAIGESPDLQRAEELNKALQNFDMDKVFSFKMFELFSGKSGLPLVPIELTDTAQCVKKIKKTGEEETFYAYPLEKENLYAGLAEQGIDCVLQTYVFWYGLDKPDPTSNIKVNLKVNAILVRIKDNKILWKNTDTDTYSMSDKMGEYEEFLANGGAKLREALVEAAEVAANELLNKLSTTTK